MQLYYFNTRGRAEPIRLLLAEAGVEYEDIRFKEGAEAMKQIEELKDQGLLPFGQVPVLKTDDGMILAQSHAILRYLAAKYGLNGNDPEQIAVADMVVCATEDLRQRFAAALAADNIPKSKVKSFMTDSPASMPEDFDKVILPKWCGYFDKLLGERGGSCFAGAFTYADLAVFDVMHLFRQSDPDCLEKWPALKQHYERVESRPNIKKWLQERPATAA